MRIIAIALFSAVTFGALHCKAAILADKPLNIGTITTGYLSNSGGQQIAENFSLSGPATANSITFYGSSVTGTYPQQAFDILFFNDAAGMPSATQFYSFNTGLITGSSVGTDGGSTIFEWTVTIPTATFAASGQYWVSVQSTTSSGSGWIWEHSSVNGDGTVVYRPGSSGTWDAAGSDNRDTQAFRLQGDLAAAPVPEPATLAIWGGLGLAGLVAARRRKRLAA